MKVALHICCGICAACAAERLISEGHQVYGFFFNPNIHPQEEYQKRLEATSEVARLLDFSLEVGLYHPDVWFSEIKGLEDEPEGGKRCEVCFRLRLRETYLYMQTAGLDVFTTTLTIGSRKSPTVINRVGQEIGGDSFLSRDFKKKDGYKRGSELADKWGIHRQHYCGCVYSPGER